MSHLVFIDFETTGLDPINHEPIEVAVVVTDDRFVEQAAFECLILPDSIPERWDAAAREMHERSGLASLAVVRGAKRHHVRAGLAAFLRRFADAGLLHLAGNSVHFDRSFLAGHFPDVERMFHHRHLDVSSIRMLGERITTMPPLSGPKPHRAMQDVRASISELAYWTEAIRHCGRRPTGL